MHNFVTKAGPTITACPYSLVMTILYKILDIEDAYDKYDKKDNNLREDIEISTINAT